MAGVKWSNDSAFPEGGVPQIGDKIVGLRGGDNYKFDFPSDGIKDGSGNYLLKWATTGAAADNYLQFTNGESGSPLKIEAAGADANIDVDFDLKGTGVLDVNGLFNINGSTSINAIIDDDTMATASATNVATSESIVAYVTSVIGAAGGSDTQLQYNNSGALGGISSLTYDGANINSTRGVAIEGSADEVQLLLKGHSSQTANTLTVQNFAGSNVFTVDNTGNVISDDTITADEMFAQSLRLSGIPGGILEIEEFAGIISPTAGYGYLFTTASNTLDFIDGAGVSHTAAWQNENMTFANLTATGTLEVQDITTLYAGDASSSAPAALTATANYNTNENLTQAGGSNTGTFFGTDNTGSVAGGYLVLTADDRSGVYYDATNNIGSDPQVGAIRVGYKSNYTGNPPTGSTYFFVVGNTGSNNNRIQVLHLSTGGIRVYFYDSTGTEFQTNLPAWSPTSGQEYDIELNYDLTAGVSRLFIDGTQHGSNITTAITRANTGLNRITVGTNINGSTYADASYNYFSIFDDVQHTTTYTPDSGEYSPAVMGVNFNNTNGENTGFTSANDATGFVDSSNYSLRVYARNTANSPTQVAAFTQAGLEMFDNRIFRTRDIAENAANDGLTYDVNSGNSHTWTVNQVEVAQLSATSLDLQVPITLGNLSFSGNTISSTNTNGDIILDPDGVGLLSVLTATSIFSDTASDVLVTLNSGSLTSSYSLRAESTTGNEFRLIDNIANIDILTRATTDQTQISSTDSVEIYSNSSSGDSHNAANLRMTLSSAGVAINNHVEIDTGASTDGIDINGDVGNFSLTVNGSTADNFAIRDENNAHTFLDYQNGAGLSLSSTNSQDIFLTPDSNIVRINGNTLRIEDAASTALALASTGNTDFIIRSGSTGNDLDIYDNINSLTRLIVKENGFIGANVVSPVAMFQSDAIVRTGTGTITTSGYAVTGSGTAFGSELRVGSLIGVSGQTRVVARIASNTSLEVTESFSPDIVVGTVFSYRDLLMLGAGVSSDFEAWPNGGGRLGNIIISDNYPEEGVDIEGAFIGRDQNGLRLCARNDGNTRAEIDIINENTANGTIDFKTTNTTGGAITRLTIDETGVSSFITDTSPVIKATRTSSDTNTDRTPIAVLHQTDQNMANDFGAFVDFLIEDDTSGEQTIARMGAVRNGADNTGKIVLSPVIAGTATDVVEIQSQGIYLQPTTSTINFTGQTSIYLNGGLWQYDLASSGDGLTMDVYRPTATTTADILQLSSDVTSTRTVHFIVEGDGDALNTNGSYGAISDQSLKENIVDAASQWDDIKAIQVRNYNFIGSEETLIGVVAQEIEQVSPKLVSEKEGIKNVKQSIIYMKAVKALQEAMARIEQLELDVAALQGA